VRDREIESEQAREIKIESERSSAKEMTREREREGACDGGVR
jgi:hypothetical protein